MVGNGGLGPIHQPVGSRVMGWGVKEMDGWTPNPSINNTAREIDPSSPIVGRLAHVHTCPLRLASTASSTRSVCPPLASDCIVATEWVCMYVGG